MGVTKWNGMSEREFEWHGIVEGKGAIFNCREMQLGLQEGFDMNLNRVRRDTWSLDVLR